MKKCELILKKERPNTIQILLNCKKTKRRPIIAPAIAIQKITIPFDRKHTRPISGEKPPFNPLTPIDNEIRTEIKRRATNAVRHTYVL